MSHNSAGGTLGQVIVHGNSAKYTRGETKAERLHPDTEYTCGACKKRGKTGCKSYCHSLRCSCKHAKKVI